nr:meiotic recombination protein SPO11-2 [Ipomoea batatas]
MGDLSKSSIFFSDQHLCYADILPPLQEKRVTQRELFYKLLCNSQEYFNSQLQVNRTVQDLVAMLQCSRYSLGIMASSRGAVAGRLLLQEPNQEFVDCSTCGSSGYAISGDLSLLEKLVMKSDARYIIVVEKWLGLRKDDIEKLVPEESLVPLKQRDVQIAKSLISSEILQDNYKEELAVMVESDRRAEIEALYFHGYDFLGKFIANKIVQMDYI